MCANARTPAPTPTHTHTPVLALALQGREEGIARSLLSASAAVRARDCNGQTAVHHAARAGAEAPCFEMLLESWDAAGTAGADTVSAVGSSACGADGAAAKAAAAAADTAADTACGTVDAWGRTALHWAVTKGHRSAVVALVEAGSDVRLRDAQGETPMDLAERRAECRAWLQGQEGARCDQLTLSMLRLMAGETEAKV